MPSRLVAAFAALLVVAGSAPAQLIQNFSGGGSPFVVGDYAGGNSTTVNNNGPAGNTTYLRLTNGTNDQNHVLYFDATFPAGPYSSISGSFDSRIFNGTNPPADGFGFMLLPTSIYGTSGVPANLPTSLGAVAWERPIQGGMNPVNPNLAGLIGWTANIFNGTPISQSSVVFDNAVVSPQANTPGGYNFHKGFGGSDGGTPFDRFTFNVNLSARLFSLSVQPNITGAAVPLYTNLALPAGVNPDDFRLALGARTGGLNQIIDVTNFNVTFTPVPEPSSMLLAGIAGLATIRGIRRRKTAAMVA